MRKKVVVFAADPVRTVKYRRLGGARNVVRLRRKERSTWKTEKGVGEYSQGGLWLEMGVDRTGFSSCLIVNYVSLVSKLCDILSSFVIRK
jgi:hypothetical protein